MSQFCYLGNAGRTEETFVKILPTCAGTAHLPKCKALTFSIQRNIKIINHQNISTICSFERSMMQLNKNLIDNGI